MNLWSILFVICLKHYRIFDLLERLSIWRPFASVSRSTVAATFRICCWNARLIFRMPSEKTSRIFNEVPEKLICSKILAKFLMRKAPLKKRTTVRSRRQTGRNLTLSCHASHYSKDSTLYVDGTPREKKGAGDILRGNTASIPPFPRETLIPLVSQGVPSAGARHASSCTSIQKYYSTFSDQW